MVCFLLDGTCNILYDVVAALSKKWGDKTADTVFRERKGCCGGHANLYKCLCTELNMPCEVFGGYLKTGFGTPDGIPTAQENHVWTLVHNGYGTHY